MIDIEDLGLSAPDGPDVPEGDRGWQPLPPQARTLFMLAGGFGAGVPSLIALIALGVLGAAVVPRPELLAAAVVAWVSLTLFAIWLGHKKYRYTHWLLDDDGFALRRGRLWRSETRVPGSRVQHLDISRGPLERRFGLATLVIHTAGTRQSAVTVPGLDAGDAERLRDHLAQRVEHDDDDA
ncbi:PH domain-containing protein [Luteimonas sp. R10]|uniref:PH domain-containing protein n=1 Tax=Luteimonas sp. R10 TaxID=3108176 RepID=UPI00308D382A|nr:PH domain-containing protein [Luteimonas sp. R10]